MANNVTTYHYDNARTGWNASEVYLTPSVVQSANFGILYQYLSSVIDDIVYAQPLCMQGLAVSGTSRNVLFIATHAGSIYAFDADRLHSSSAPWLWKTSLINTAAGEVAAGDGSLKATPVIDAAPASGAAPAIMYAVVRFQDTNGVLHFRLHALDATTGMNIAGMGPTVIDPMLSPGDTEFASYPAGIVPPVPGSGDPQTSPGSGQVYFQPAMQFNRPALLLANSTVYVAFGSTGDNPPYHGWVMAFGENDLQLKGSFCTTPGATAAPLGTQPCFYGTPTLGGSVWQAGFGPAADSEGFIYCITGNGLNDLGIANPPQNYAESLLQLNPQVNLVGSFTPPNPAALTALDTDFGSAGPLVIPDGAGGGKFVIGCGKDANVYLLDRSQLAANLNQIGKYQSKLSLVSNSGNSGLCGSGIGVWGGPGYYGGPLGNLIYYCGDNGPLQAILVSNGALSPAQTSSGIPNQTPTAAGQEFDGEGGVIPVVTSNGSVAGTALVWAIVRNGAAQLAPVHLRAYDAADLTKGYLFDDPRAGMWQGGPGGPGDPFLAPVVVNGKAYVASAQQLTVYGLLLPEGNGALIEGTYRPNANQPGNFEALIQEGNNIRDYYRDSSSPALTWHSTVAVSTAATGPACLIQSTFGAWPTQPGNFEALVQEGNNIVHYYRDNSVAGFPWMRTVVVSSAATGPASLIQSTFGAGPNQPGNFEALVQEGNNIVHYYRDNSASGFPWMRTAVVSSATTGPACLIQSTFGAGPNQPGNFEALVQEGNNIVHYYRNNSAPGFPWIRTAVVSSAATGPACLIQSTFGAGIFGDGNFEALVQEGSNIVHYYRNNSAPGFPWMRTVDVSSAATGPACLIQGSFRPDPSQPGNFEALIQEGTNIVHYYRNNTAAGFPWMRTVVVSSVGTAV